jgi:chaperonin GroEL
VDVREVQLNLNEDATQGTKAAVEEGIVPRGGVALLRAAKLLEDSQADAHEQIGIGIILRAVEEPMRWIERNAGHEDSTVVPRRENLVHARVTDPSTAVRPAPENAASIASLLLTMEAVISGISERHQAEATQRHGGRS